MTPRLLAIACTLGLMTGGCAHVKKDKPLKVNTAQHSPVRIHVYEWPDKAKKAKQTNVKRILILPPLGIDDPDVQRSFHQQIYSAAQRRFTTPLKIVLASSAYAPYIDESNLVRNDGTLNIKEVAVIGALMNSSHVICPYVLELKPYHPQRIDIRLSVVNSGTGKVSAELSSVFDARENDVFDYFMEYSKSHQGLEESEEDLRLKIKSPTAFQAFVADLCNTVMADRLPF